MVRVESKYVSMCSKCRTLFFHWRLVGEAFCPDKHGNHIFAHSSAKPWLVEDVINESTKKWPQKSSMPLEMNSWSGQLRSSVVICTKKFPPKSGIPRMEEGQQTSQVQNERRGSRTRQRNGKRRPSGKATPWRKIKLKLKQAPLNRLFFVWFWHIVWVATTLAHVSLWRTMLYAYHFSHTPIILLSHAHHFSHSPIMHLSYSYLAPILHLSLIANPTD